MLFPNINERLSYKSWIEMLCYSLLSQNIVLFFFFFPFSDLLLGFWRDYSLVLYPYIFPLVSCMAARYSSLFPITCCSVKTVHLHFSQITTSHEQHYSAENLLSVLSTLAAITPSTFLLSLGHVTHVFQQMPAVPSIQHTILPSGTFCMYSIFILLDTSFYLVNTIYSFTPGLSHQVLCSLS